MTAPVDLLGLQIDAKKVVFQIGSKVQLAERNARGYALVFRGIRHFETAKQLVAVVDVIYADAGLVRDVKESLDSIYDLAVAFRSISRLRVYHQSIDRHQCECN